MWASIGTVVSAIVAAIALVVTWRQSRKSELRRDDVLMWANEVIHCLQNIVLICEKLHERQKEDADHLAEFSITASILVERGRLFFRNEIIDDYGAEKHTAYRGYRPRILDHIVIAHQIATEWPNEDLDGRRKMQIIASDCLQAFVSLVQREVGRSRTASKLTRKGGICLNLRELMDAVDQARLREAADKSGNSFLERPQGQAQSSRTNRSPSIRR